LAKLKIDNQYCVLEKML